MFLKNIFILLFSVLLSGTYVQAMDLPETPSKGLVKQRVAQYNDISQNETLPTITLKGGIPGFSKMLKEEFSLLIDRREELYNNFCEVLTDYNRMLSNYPMNNDLGTKYKSSGDKYKGCEPKDPLVKVYFSMRPVLKFAHKLMEIHLKESYLNWWNTCLALNLARQSDKKIGILALIDSRCEGLDVEFDKLYKEYKEAGVFQDMKEEKEWSSDSELPPQEQYVFDNNPWLYHCIMEIQDLVKITEALTPQQLDQISWED